MIPTGVALGFSALSMGIRVPGSYKSVVALAIAMEIDSAPVAAGIDEILLDPGFIDAHDASAAAMALPIAGPSGSSPDPNVPAMRPSRPSSTLLKFHDGSQPRTCLTQA